MTIDPMYDLLFWQTAASAAVRAACLAARGEAAAAKELLRASVPRLAHDRTGPCP